MFFSLVANRELKTGGEQKGGQEEDYFPSLEKKKKCFGRKQRMLIVNSFNILKKKGKENKTQQYFGLYKFCIWVDVTVRDLSLQ